MAIYLDDTQPATRKRTLDDKENEPPHENKLVCLLPPPTSAAPAGPMPGPVPVPEDSPDPASAPNDLPGIQYSWDGEDESWLYQLGSDGEETETDDDSAKEEEPLEELIALDELQVN